MVAAGLLLVILSVVGQVTVRSGRVQQQTRRQHIAMQELSNQLDRLTMLPASQLDEAIAELAPSPLAQQSLSDVEITAKRIEGAEGSRLLVRLTWQRIGKAATLSLVGWRHPTAVSVDSPNIGSPSAEETNP